MRRNAHCARDMSERLLIRLHADGLLTWLVQDAGGRPLAAANPGAPPPGTVARARRIVALVPAEQVVVLETDAVSARRAQLAKAIPFALEDQLASPVEDLHFALPQALGAPRLPVAVVARAALRGWIEALAQHGIHADAMVSEAFALPVEAGAATLLVEADRALLRWAPAGVCACDTGALDAWLRALAPPPLQVHDFRQAARLELPVAATAYHERQADALAFLARHLDDAASINLLQGEFAPSHRHAPLPQLWRRAAWLAAAALLLALTYAGADRLRLQRESDALEAAQRQALRAQLPQLGDVAGDPRALMQSAIARMRGGSGGSGLLPLLGRIAPILASTTRVRLTGLEYRNDTLELGLRAPDVAALDLVREQLAGLGGLTVEVTAAASGDAGVDGRLRISGGKS
jgi:general secretion pathway protein L